MRLLPFVLAIGVLLSLYAWYVEYRFLEAQRLGLQYRALCDVGIFSCSKVFTSEFGYLSQFFGLPRISNAAVGVALYVVELLVERSFPRVLLAISAMSCAASVGLFLLLTVRMKDFCLVCFSIYIINIVTLISAWATRPRAAQGTRAPGNVADASVGWRWEERVTACWLP